MDEIKEPIRQFLHNHLNHQHKIDDTDDIFALGFVNSIFAISLVMFLEEQFDIQIDNKDLNLANFRSVEKMKDLVVQSKTAS